MTQDNQENAALIVAIRPQVENYSVSLENALKRHAKYKRLLRVYEDTGNAEKDEDYVGAFDSAREEEVGHIIRAPAETLSEVHSKAALLLERLIETNAHLIKHPCDAYDFGLFASIVQDLERLSKGETGNTIAKAA